MEMEYTIVIEKAPGNYAAYVPDLPGCLATGATRDEAIREIETAIAPAYREPSRARRVGFGSPMHGRGGGGRRLTACLGRRPDWPRRCVRINIDGSGREIDLFHR